MQIRHATIQDIGSFKRLWAKFMQQQAKEGSLILPNERNLRSYTELFQLYVSGKLLGLVLLVSDSSKDIGIHFEGVPPTALDLTIGKYTMLFGDYLEPEYRGRGITHKMYEAAMKWTYEQGFTGGVTGVLVGDQRIGEVLKKVVDGKHGATATRPFTVEVCWEFSKPNEVGDRGK